MALILPLLLSRWILPNRSLSFFYHKDTYKHTYITTHYTLHAYLMIPAHCTNTFALIYKHYVCTHLHTYRHVYRHLQTH